MKKILLSSALALFSVAAGFSQGLPNGSFENWTGTTYDVLTNYTGQSSNIQSLQQIGQITMTKVADPFHASFAIRMDTKTNGVDTTFGFFINGNPGGSSVPGGIPYTQIPTGLHGHYKSGVVVGDSAIVLVFFKKFGVVIGQYVQYITGNHAAYTTFDLPISGLPFAPDSVVIGAASSNPFSVRPNFQGLPGSFLQLDSLSFTGVVSQPLLMNGDFESWSTSTYYTPDYWKTQGDSVQRSTVAHSGIYSLELQVTPQNGGGGGGTGANADQATTGHYTPHSGPAGGRPYTIQNDSLIGYYKLVSMGTDTASISVNTSFMGSSVGGGWMQFLGNASYQRFAIAVNSSVVPDTMRIDIQAGNWPVRTACIGSKLYIDQLSMQSSPLSVPLVIMGNDKVEVYPNPSRGLFNLIYDSNSDETVSVEIYNSLGQKLFSKQLNGQAEMRTQLDFSSYGKGIYFMKTIQGNHVSSTKMIVE